MGRRGVQGCVGGCGVGNGLIAKANQEVPIPNIVTNMRSTATGRTVNDTIIMLYGDSW